MLDKGGTANGKKVGGNNHGPPIIIPGQVSGKGAVREGGIVRIH